jgi:hypothetical protein
MWPASIIAGSFIFGIAHAANFPFESNTLTDVRTSNLKSSPATSKVFPGDADWPTTDEWNLLNQTLGGALLKPEPLPAACYPGHPSFNQTQCSFILTTRQRVFIDDALSLGNVWPQGNTCPLTGNPAGNCTRGGYPEYVVNATTARQIQIAVNFARNRNIRLTVK